MPALTNRQEVYVTYLASAALQPQRGLAPDERRTTWGRATGGRVIGGGVIGRRVIGRRGLGCRSMRAAKAEVRGLGFRGAGISFGNCAALETVQLL